MKKLLFSILILLSVTLIKAQDEQFRINYSEPKKFTISAVNVTGNDLIDKNVIISYSGLAVGNEIFVPSDDITKAISNLWKQKMFSDIRIEIDNITGNTISLNIVVKTRPRLSRYSIKGITKNEADKVREKISLRTGDIVTDQMLQNATNQITSFFIEKGYYYPDIKIIQEKDTLLSDNSIKLSLIINRNKRVRIKEITFEGNNEITSKRLRRLLKKTKKYQFWNVFRSSKMISDLYEEDKDNVINFYNSKGYRDARIISDSVYLAHEQQGFLKLNKLAGDYGLILAAIKLSFPKSFNGIEIPNELSSKKSLYVNIKLHEGKKYYFRNITWSGNTKYSSEQLAAVMGIKKGDIYDLKQLDQKLSMSPSGIDVSSLYMDNGYLFFNVKPIETQITGDSIDIELRIFEGPQAIINKIIVSGNVKTSDYVILREIRTRPGQKFSRADVIRSQRELSQLGYFDPEQMNIIPTPNIENGTVNIEYKLTEKPSDQLQLQGGWGAGQFVGSIAIIFTNFSSKKMFKLKEWRPLPSGDGQSVSFKFQSNAIYYTSYNISFTEPWLGGKKPNSFTVSAYYQRQTNGLKQGEPNRQQIDIIGGSVGLGKRLRWPDDYFTMYNEVSLQRYNLLNYSSEFSFSNGISNNLNFRHVISRNSVDQPIYPRSGSSISLSLQWTPPYSLFSNKNYSTLSDQEKYKWVEYHKWKFDASWYLNIFAKLVLNTKLQFGFLGLYNRDLGVTPFERFYVGGDGLGNMSLLGREYIALRGYDNSSLTPENNKERGGTIFNKYVFELRYPLSLNPQATIYVLGFAEAGNSWLRFKDFDPFKVYRSLGLGVRIFMPYFGQLGFDWGYGFDNVPGKPDVNKGNFHISIGQQF